jgi:hypothetical protein
MKKLQFLLIVVLAAVTLNSCKKDETTNPVNNSNLIGYWSLTDKIIHYSDGTPDDSSHYAIPSTHWDITTTQICVNDGTNVECHTYTYKQPTLIINNSNLDTFQVVAVNTSSLTLKIQTNTGGYKLLKYSK